MPRFLSQVVGSMTAAARTMNSCFPWIPEELHARAGEELVKVVALEDEEADGDEVELNVHEESDGPPADGAEGEPADVRVAGDGAVGAHAALDERAGVAADGADDGEQQQAEP
uniref:Uncharacterized protein n=1 Tax=Oryza brachyantha TaxID=4533 RepID=J3L1L1_ORYBR